MDGHSPSLSWVPHQTGSGDPEATFGGSKALSHETSCLILMADVALGDTLQKVPGRVSSLVALTIKCLPAMWETRIRSLGQEGLLEKEMATHSSTLAWRFPRTVEPCGLPSMGSHRVGHD